MWFFSTSKLKWKFGRVGTHVKQGRRPALPLFFPIMETLFMHNLVFILCSSYYGFYMNTYEEIDRSHWWNTHTHICQSRAIVNARILLFYLPKIVSEDSYQKIATTRRYEHSKKCNNRNLGWSQTKIKTSKKDHSKIDSWTNFDSRLIRYSQTNSTNKREFEHKQV
jgi:hypothetical protein